MTLHNLAKVVNEGELDEMLDALIAQDQADKLAEQTNAS
jgi:protein subunit release factor A